MVVGFMRCNEFGRPSMYYGQLCNRAMQSDRETVRTSSNGDADDALTLLFERKPPWALYRGVYQGYFFFFFIEGLGDLQNHGKCRKPCASQVTLILDSCRPIASAVCNFVYGLYKLFSSFIHNALKYHGSFRVCAKDSDFIGCL